MMKIAAIASIDWITIGIDWPIICRIASVSLVYVLMMSP